LTIGFTKEQPKARNHRDDFYKVKTGSLDIKKFDLTGIAGTFSLKADKKGQEINLPDAFDFPCIGGGSRCKL
jgi:hypothetical protein